MHPFIHPSHAVKPLSRFSIRLWSRTMKLTHQGQQELHQLSWCLDLSRAFLWLLALAGRFLTAEKKTGVRRNNHITSCSCSMISSQSYFLFVCATNQMEWCCLQSVRLQGKLSFDRARFKRAGFSRLSSFAGKVTGDHVVLQLLHSLSSSLCIFSVSFHKAAVSCNGLLCSETLIEKVSPEKNSLFHICSAAML